MESFLIYIISKVLTKNFDIVCLSLEVIKASMWYTGHAMCSIK